MQSKINDQLYQQSQQQIVSFIDNIPRQIEQQDNKWRIKSQLDYSQERLHIKTLNNVVTEKSIIHGLKNIQEEVIKTTSIMDEVYSQQNKRQNNQKMIRQTEHLNLHQKGYYKRQEQHQFPLQNYQFQHKKSNINFLTNKIRHANVYYSSQEDEYYKNERKRILQELNRDMNAICQGQNSIQKSLSRKLSEKKVVIHQIITQLSSKSTEKILIRPTIKESEIKIMNYYQFKFLPQSNNRPQNINNNQNVTKNKKKKWLETKNQIKQAAHHIKPKILIQQSQQVQQVQIPNQQLQINQNVTSYEPKKQEIKNHDQSNEVTKQNQIKPLNPFNVNHNNINHEDNEVKNEGQYKNSQTDIFTFSRIKNQNVYSFNNLNIQAQSFQKHTKNVSIQLQQQHFSELSKPFNAQMVLGCIYCEIMKKRCTFH